MTVTPSFEMSGSMLAGTAEHRLVGIDTHLDIITEQDSATVRAMVDQAERMCFVMDAVTRPHEISSITTRNGEELD